MKNLKFLFTSLILVFILSSFVNDSGKPEKVVFSGSVPCYCAGEMLDYEVVYNYFDNGKVEHYNAMGGTLIGRDSGDVYRFIDSESYRSDGGVVFSLRFINKGVVRIDLFVINGTHQLIHSGCGSQGE